MGKWGLFLKIIFWIVYAFACFWDWGNSKIQIFVIGTGLYFIFISTLKDSVRDGVEEALSDFQNTIKDAITEALDERDDRKLK
jgi:hypothetical protein